MTAPGTTKNRNRLNFSTLQTLEDTQNSELGKYGTLDRRSSVETRARSTIKEPIDQ
jgi:hypothetical protein